MITKSKANEIIDKIAMNYKPNQILLFGSFANGNHNKDSDLDLFIIKNTVKSPFNRTKEVYKLLRGSKVPVDVFVYTQEEFDKYKEIPSTVENEVFKRGKIVYMELTKKQVIKEW